MVKKSKYVKERTKRKDLERENRELRNAVKHPGSLKNLGFTEQESTEKEKKAIRRADKKYGKAETDRKLGFLETVTKHYPGIHEKIRSILKWNERR
jgi:Holliday junction resolvasome RuvABC DNA-binding subunit